MTVYNSTDYGTVLDYAGDRGRLSVTKRGHGNFVILSEDDRVNLALELLADSHEIHENFDGSVTLHRKPQRAQCGQYYRVQGNDTMAEPWCESPIAKVVQIHQNGYDNIVLETIGGDRTDWGQSTAGLTLVEVKVQEEWVVTK